MTVLLARDLRRIESATRSVGRVVQRAVQGVGTAVREGRAPVGDPDLKHELRVAGNRLELDCADTIMRHRPVSQDLRHVVNLIQAANNFVRLGTLISDLQHSTAAIAGGGEATKELVRAGSTFDRLIDCTVRLIGTAVDNMLQPDLALQRLVVRIHNDAKELEARIARSIAERVGTHPATLDRCIQVLVSSRLLLRIADAFAKHSARYFDDIWFEPATRETTAPAPRDQGPTAAGSMA